MNIPVILCIHMHQYATYWHLLIASSAGCISVNLNLSIAVHLCLSVASQICIPSLPPHNPLPSIARSAWCLSVRTSAGNTPAFPKPKIGIVSHFWRKPRWIFHANRLDMSFSYIVDDTDNTWGCFKYVRTQIDNPQADLSNHHLQGLVSHGVAVDYAAPLCPQFSMEHLARYGEMKLVNPRYSSKQ